MPMPQRFRRTLTAIGLVLALAVPGAVLASHQFSDVPTNHTFHNDIDALVDSGVTSGCGGGKYCPNSFVTRGQMAAFLNRLGALAPGKPPVVNADRLDGADATAFARPLSAVVDADGTLVRGVGAIDVQIDGANQYIVRFNRNVRSCAYTATVGLSGSILISPPGFITVVGSLIYTDGVYVETRNVDGDEAALGFHLNVVCPGTTGGTTSELVENVPAKQNGTSAAGNQ